MDGCQMIRSLRAIELRDSRSHALALTAFARSEDRKRALVAGFQAHLTKPFNVAELVPLVVNLVGR
jgi:CheY-like chemotaxis protein